MKLEAGALPAVLLEYGGLPDLGRGSADQSHDPGSLAPPPLKTTQLEEIEKVINNACNYAGVFDYRDYLLSNEPKEYGHNQDVAWLATAVVFEAGGSKSVAESAAAVALSHGLLERVESKDDQRLHELWQGLPSSVSQAVRNLRENQAGEPGWQYPGKLWRPWTDPQILVPAVVAVADAYTHAAMELDCTSLQSDEVMLSARAVNAPPAVSEALSGLYRDSTARRPDILTLEEVQARLVGTGVTVVL